MLTQTSETALKALIYLVMRGDHEPVPPREIAEHVGASPSYMAKITRMLVKSNILRSHRGALGGVSISRPASEITLLEVVEACQGLLIGNYCHGISDHLMPVCAFHEAMYEVHQATISILTKWNLADLSTCPRTAAGLPPNLDCKMRIPMLQEAASRKG